MYNLVESRAEALTEEPEGWNLARLRGPMDRTPFGAAAAMPSFTPAPAMHSAFNQFAAFTQDAAGNKAFVAKGKLTIPVLNAWRLPSVRV